MIKYFSFEQYYKDGKVITENEKVLYEKPYTFEYGYYSSILREGYCFTIDVEKYIECYGSLDSMTVQLKNVYDKLLLQERNKKLETL